VDRYLRFHSLRYGKQVFGSVSQVYDHIRE
jgi:hypothetical protein